MGGLSIKNLKRKFDSLEMEYPQHLPTSVAVHEHFEKDQEPVIERSEHDETSENLTSTKYIDPSRVEDSSNCEGSADLHHSPSIVEFDETSSQISYLVVKRLPVICELLLQIENQLSSCEAEMKELETCVGEVCRDMLESQKSLQTASQEAEEATKLCHQREQKRNAAKAALEKP